MANVVTPKFKMGYPNLFKPRKNEMNGKDEYSVVALFDKGEDLSVLKKAAQEAIAKKWGADKSKWPQNLRTPFRDQGEKGKIDEVTGKKILPPGHEDGAFFLNLRSQQKLGVVDENVQPILDEQARKEISRSSAESALMIAVSPLAIVDMAFIAWRNIRLINRIAAIYGIELGYYSRIRLFRMVLINIAFAGASELIREVGMDWLSQDITARLSTRAAQGIGAGLLTARLGIKAMELCRPLPWIEDKPRLGDFRRQLIGQLKNAIPSKKDNV